MAYENNPSQGGEDMYSDGAPAESESSEPKKDDESQESVGQTAVLPRSICPGMKPGEEVVLHIDSVSDDSYVVSYAPEKPSQDEPGAKEGSSSEAPQSGMSSMME